jgi:CYTH domain-containing protein
MLRLSRKADVDAHTRLVTSIYLLEQEFAILATSLRGLHVKKVRHRLQGLPGIEMLVDEFERELQGLIIAEAQFNTADELATFPTPDFAIREVTDDPRFTGAHLAKNGLPVGL